ncbi:glycosyltransferase [Helicobacter cappadocius]|uniref:Glycosyltransferase n=1 Tax=Helicobacter cappadocius TaxID=3063998 RepID=A0AA90Q2W0_9HELI|nr:MULTISPECIES: glycosyltransferase [unclassified Helicobacter]MDO7253204.1 glycosyltransferase [Helicobacter sp. faydin-H75]MDP2539128.1 glycosyltransferase [Helicobacter sp. faydin-H76]
MIDLSVIIPIYNVEDYLRECLDCVISQSLENIQIICINDGSTDKSLSIILEYARRDARIEVVDKKNSGYGHSCNIGIHKALGKYIAILEPDDFIDLSMYENLIKIAQRADLDIVKCAYYEYFDSTKQKDSYMVLPRWTQNITPSNEVFDTKEFPSLLFYHPSIWAGVYKREFLMENNIRFVEAKGASWVDNPFFIQTMCLAKKISYTTKPYYFYRQSNPNSSSNLINFSVPLERMRDMNEFLIHHKEMPTLVFVLILKKYIRYLLLSIYIAKNQKIPDSRIESEIYILIDNIIENFKMPKMLKLRFLSLRFFPLGVIYHLYSVLRWIKYRFLK